MIGASVSFMRTGWKVSAKSHRSIFGGRKGALSVPQQPMGGREGRQVREGGSARASRLPPARVLLQLP